MDVVFISSEGCRIPLKFSDRRRKEHRDSNVRIRADDKLTALEIEWNTICVVSEFSENTQYLIDASEKFVKVRFMIQCFPRREPRQ
jgi:hypothetical protein